MAQHYEVDDESAPKFKPRPHRFCPRHGHGSDLVSTVYVPAAWRFLLFLSRRIFFGASLASVAISAPIFFIPACTGIYVCLNRRPGCNQGATLSILIFLPAYSLTRLEELPRSPLIQWFILMALLEDHASYTRTERSTPREQKRSATTEVPVMLIGAGDARNSLSGKQPRSERTVVCRRDLDDKGGRVGRSRRCTHRRGYRGTERYLGKRALWPNAKAHFDT